MQQPTDGAASGAAERALKDSVSSEPGMPLTGSRPLQAADGLRAALQDTSREERATW